jgi:hypothetical protein
VSTTAPLGALTNTVTVTPPGDYLDTNTGNNSASASVTVTA